MPGSDRSGPSSVGSWAGSMGGSGRAGSSKIGAGRPRPGARPVEGTTSAGEGGRRPVGSAGGVARPGFAGAMAAGVISTGTGELTGAGDRAIASDPRWAALRLGATDRAGAGAAAGTSTTGAGAGWASVTGGTAGSRRMGSPSPSRTTMIAPARTSDDTTRAATHAPGPRRERASPAGRSAERSSACPRSTRGARGSSSSSKAPAASSASRGSRAARAAWSKPSGDGRFGAYGEDTMLRCRARRPRPGPLPGSLAARQGTAKKGASPSRAPAPAMVGRPRPR